MERNMNDLLRKTTVFLANFLERTLPSLFEDWWNKAVVANLSFQQQRRVEERHINSLTSLDLGSLLRVFDYNWYQISMKLNLTSEARHFLKEMQTVRNRWAHAGAEEFPIEELYRDLDTLQRFASIINANDDFINEVRATKASVLDAETTRFNKDEKKVQEPERETKESSAEFEPGQIVFLKSNPAIKGAIVEVLPGKPENRFKVFINGDTQTYYASQLQAKEKQEEEFRSVSCEKFHALLTALQIRHPGLSILYSLNAARIDFIPYQFRPVLKFIRSDRPRLLIADSVGVGKTIEAGLILRELQARRDIRSILIICPRPLVTDRKWENEMRRFEERFTPLDGKTLRYCINEMDLDGAWPEKHEKTIIPYSLFDEETLFGSGRERKRRRKKGILNLDPPPRFDLVIVDEAHHIRNTNTFAHKAVRFFCEHAEAVLFLTATPIQLGSRDLFVLLNTLRPDLIIDQKSFEHLAEPNPFINRAVSFARAQEPEWETRAFESLDQAAATPWGKAILCHNPEFINIRDQLQKGEVKAEDRIQMITDIESLNAFSGIINRTRRRDIGDFTIRKPETVTVDFTPEQKHLHDELLKIQAEIYRSIHGDKNVNFMITTIRRQAASCLFGLAPFLEDILNRRMDELTWEETDDEEHFPQEGEIDEIKSGIQRILEMARALDPIDPKLEALRSVIRNKRKQPNNKMMIFSSFRHTLHYLYDHLRKDGFRVGMIHGGTPDDERAELRDRFKMEKNQYDSLDVLLFSEIGSEGLDFQFCDMIVNYDLPWNPMKIEQRIGRIDRFGQKSECVGVVNLVTPGTVDADIYERCLLRIGVFNSALGGSEEILGDITREIKNIAENFSLTEEERRTRLQQLADNKIRLIQEQEELEQRQIEIFGVRLPEDRMRKEIDEASSFWLTPDSIRRIAELYLQETCGKEQKGREQEFILGEKPLKTLRLSQEARSALLKDFQKLPRQNAMIYREWEKWLKGGNPHLNITFDSECASRHRDAVFLTPIHPLVKQAAAALDYGKRIFCALKVQSGEIPAGRYEFVIYQWRSHGIREDLVLKPIATSPLVTERLIQLLETAEDISEEEPAEGAASVWEELEARHYKMWAEARERHRARTRDHAEYRRESLAASHKARMTILEEQLSRAEDENIRKMRQSQITSADADYARRIQEMDIAIERADIIAEPVAYGILHVLRGDNNEP